MTQLALASLIGRTRARVLRELSRPGGHTTTALARRLRISLASASEHAYALRAAGLIHSVRVGTCVEHRITRLGRALLSPERASPCAAGVRPARTVSR